VKVLITGGSGFIGNHLARRLIDEGHQINILDTHPSNIENCNFIAKDIKNLDDVEDAVNGCDIVCHLAAKVSVIKTEQDPIGTYYINTVGTTNVLAACLKYNISKIFFTSSSEVYGNPEKIPITENGKLNPVSTYGRSKIAAEKLIELSELKYSIVRLFNVYGGGQRTDFVIPKFIHLALNDKPITIYGEGEQVRSFCHVSDIVDGILLAMFESSSIDQVFNIGNDQEPLTMLELADKIFRLIDKPSKLDFVGFPDRTANREIYRRIPDINKAKKLLKYNPKISLDEGLMDVIKWWRLRV
jgi:nucleoside-diphosphate-sugar epimerase|tara:strand:+ start:5782 stop:6681 length:900 start_codon:yes stop_codon:yes gene_type:complete